MRICTRCILPETAKGIVLDDQGLCQLCRDYKSYTPRGEDALRDLLKGRINSDAARNCIVPVSGGRDSAYALYYAAEVLKLKPLAVHSNNDFETDIANRNLEVMTKSLNVPLIRVGTKGRIARKIVAEKFKMNAPYGPGLIVDQTCEACEYGFHSAAYNIAKKENIEVILWGDSKEESTVPFHEIFPHHVPSKWERLSKPGFLSYLKYKMFFRELTKVCGSDQPNGFLAVHLYDYIRWDRKTIVETIKGRMGWTVPENSPTTWRVDCSLVPLVNYLTQKAYGVSKIEIGFSSMIRSGKMDRADALRQVEEIKRAADPAKLRALLVEMDVPERVIDQVLF